MNETTEKKGLPMAARVLIGVVLGAAAGAALGAAPVVFGYGTPALGELGMLVIRALKALATPLVLLAILDGLLKSNVDGRSARRLLVVCALNVTVAFAIGLALMNGLTPGKSWQERVRPLIASATTHGAPAAHAGGPSLDPVQNLGAWVPESLIEPFARNNVIGVVLIALLFGFALRRARRDRPAEIAAVEALVSGAYGAVVVALSWLIELVPFAVFGVVASTVGKSGLGIFGSLWTFAGVILLGLALHALLYYPLLAWIAGGRSPRVFFAGGFEAIAMGLSTNSSLATVPVTLRCLTDKLGVSEGAARLSACVGTNLNNDGIALYEAMAALFLAQACGFELSLGSQLMVLGAALMSGVGVAGVPESGLVVLPLVLAAAGLPEPVVAAAIPLILPVDWIIARCRSAVNVMSDLVVAIAIDGAPAVETNETVEAIAAVE